ncbi:hypothetical protein JCM11641_003981 [Rhodosporidiobolus odoratus]
MTRWWPEEDERLCSLVDSLPKPTDWPNVRFVLASVGSSRTANSLQQRYGRIKAQERRDEAVRVRQNALAQIWTPERDIKLLRTSTALERLMGANAWDRVIKQLEIPDLTETMAKQREDELRREGWRTGWDEEGKLWILMPALSAVAKAAPQGVAPKRPFAVSSAVNIAGPSTSSEPAKRARITSRYPSPLPDPTTLSWLSQKPKSASATPSMSNTFPQLQPRRCASASAVRASSVTPASAIASKPAQQAPGHIEKGKGKASASFVSSSAPASAAVGPTQAPIFAQALHRASMSSSSAAVDTPMVAQSTSCASQPLRLAPVPPAPHNYIQAGLCRQNLADVPAPASQLGHGFGQPSWRFSLAGSSPAVPAHTAAASTPNHGLLGGTQPTSKDASKDNSKDSTRTTFRIPLPAAPQPRTTTSRFPPPTASTSSSPTTSQIRAVAAAQRAAPPAATNSTQPTSLSAASTFPRPIRPTPVATTAAGNGLATKPTVPALKPTNIAPRSAAAASTPAATQATQAPAATPVQSRKEVLAARRKKLERQRAVLTEALDIADELLAEVMREQKEP